MPAKPENTAKIHKAIVMPAVNLREMGWLKKETDLLQSHKWFIYCMGRTRRDECHYPRSRKGREAAAYLSYIVDFYDVLPKYTVFIHSIRHQWHNDFLGDTTIPILKRLRHESADRVGFANLKCSHFPGCPLLLEPLTPSPKDLKKNNIRARFPDVYQHFFNTTRAEVPEAIGAACCAEFVVSRDRIRKRSRAEYERMLEWLERNEVDSARDAGWVFEVTWHIIFGKEPVQ
ncbi:hypothetical protein AMS68_007613 [Peltaster fructicola]|uniref:Uncharacterized protein n=1 Tax=Peltaster fructicola TaxID=286661 RepID=A0A6H0Y557_9PEZI|nr:hypothetical protein AMS68_007613 [Peltaster fructicola]